MAENDGRDGCNLRRNRPRGDGDDRGHLQSGRVLFDRPCADHAQLRDPQGVRHRGGVPRPAYGAGPLRGIHARRERQCGDVGGGRPQKDRKTGRVRQVVPHQVRGRLPRQADDGGRTQALRRTSDRGAGRAAAVRAAHYEDDGFPGLLPHRAGLYPRRTRRTGRFGGTGPWLGRRFGRGLLSRHHADRPHRLRPAVRAFPEPRPYFASRYRRGLRRRRPRPRAELGDAEIRQGEGGAHHHLRHDGHQTGHQGRCARAEAPALRVGPSLQAGPRQDSGQEAQFAERHRLCARTESRRAVGRSRGEGHDPLCQDARRQRPQHGRARLRYDHLPRRHHRLGARLDGRRQGDRRKDARHAV